MIGLDRMYWSVSVWVELNSVELYLNGLVSITLHLVGSDRVGVDCSGLHSVGLEWVGFGWFGLDSTDVELIRFERNGLLRLILWDA